MRVAGLIPPSGLPAISPSRGEITSGKTFVFKKAMRHAVTLTESGESAPSQSPPLRGRCPAGQRGVSHPLLHEDGVCR